MRTASPAGFLSSITPASPEILEINRSTLDNKLSIIKFNVDISFFNKLFCEILPNKINCHQISEYSHWKTVFEKIQASETNFNQHKHNIFEATSHIDQHNYDNISDNLEALIEGYVRAEENYLSVLKGALDYISKKYETEKPRIGKSSSDLYLKYAGRFNQLHERYNNINFDNQEIIAHFKKVTNKIAIECGANKAKIFAAKILGFLKKIFGCCAYYEEEKPRHFGGNPFLRR